MLLKNVMKIALGFSMLFAVAFGIVSCDKEVTQIIETESTLEETSFQIGDLIEETVTMEEFNSMMEAENLPVADAEFEARVQEIDNPNTRANACTTCNPRIYNVNVYNLGFRRGLGVNGGRNYPCDYRISFYPGPGVQKDWSSGSFGLFNFVNGPGQYYVYVALRSCDPGLHCCLVQKKVYFNI